MAAGATRTAEPDFAAALVRTAADAVSELPETLAGVGRDAAVTVARAAYTSAYFVAYAAVFSAVFVARALPQENPVMEGLGDGGRAARDVLAELPAKKRPGR